MTQTMVLKTTPTQRERFSLLLESHRKLVFKVAHTYASMAEERADLAQDICAQLWRAFPSYDESRSFSTWMYRIALNVGISHLRATTTRESHMVALNDSVHAGAMVGEIVEPDERVRDLHHFIGRLDALNRALLLLLLEDRGYREIAEILGLSETNVATRISRLKQRIRNEHLNRENPDHGVTHAV
jgi:RNA polymerase sigma-70 factor (ECF subfamily)